MRQLAASRCRSQAARGMGAIRPQGHRTSRHCRVAMSRLWDCMSSFMRPPTWAALTRLRPCIRNKTLKEKCTQKFGIEAEQAGSCL